MALEGPRVVYTRIEEETPLARALRLAREIEELLEETSSTGVIDLESSTHSTRIARAMAAGLVDELENIERTDRKSRLS